MKHWSSDIFVNESSPIQDENSLNSPCRIKTATTLGTRIEKQFVTIAVCIYLETVKWSTSKDRPIIANIVDKCWTSWEIANSQLIIQSAKTSAKIINARYLENSWIAEMDDGVTSNCIESSDFRELKSDHLGSKSCHLAFKIQITDGKVKLKVWITV